MNNFFYLSLNNFYEYSLIFLYFVYSGGENLKYLKKYNGFLFFVQIYIYDFSF